MATSVPRPLPPGFFPMGSYQGPGVPEPGRIPQRTQAPHPSGNTGCAAGHPQVRAGGAPAPCQRPACVCAEAALRSFSPTRQYVRFPSVIFLFYALHQYPHSVSCTSLYRPGAPQNKMTDYAPHTHSLTQKTDIAGFVLFKKYIGQNKWVTLYFT